jgi:hypothetical protein
MGNGRIHWALESVPEPDGGCEDGCKRVVGLILMDNWSKAPDDVMRFVLRAINAYRWE